MTNTTFALDYPGMSGYVPLCCVNCGRSFGDGEEVEVIHKDQWRGVEKARCLNGCDPSRLGVESDVEPGRAETHPELDDDGEVECVSGRVDEAEYLGCEEDEHLEGSLEGGERTEEDA